MVECYRQTGQNFLEINKNGYTSATVHGFSRSIRASRDCNGRHLRRAVRFGQSRSITIWIH